MAAKFEFQGTLHRNLREMHDAIAEEWLGAGGSNTPEDIAQLLRLPIEHLAAEAADSLGLDGNSVFDPISLRDAFARIRDSLENRF